MGTDMPLLLQGGFFAALLGAASAWDIKKRIIPDSICLGVALTGLLIFEPMKLFGILAAVPFLLAALVFGGMGGGDIKLMAAAGLVLGLQKGIAAIIMGLTGMLAFHAICFIVQKLRGRMLQRHTPSRRFFLSAASQHIF